MTSGDCDSLPSLGKKYGPGVSVQTSQLSGEEKTEKKQLERLKLCFTLSSDLRLQTRIVKHVKHGETSLFPLGSIMFQSPMVMNGEA